jgi:hypothetical protein
VRTRCASISSAHAHCFLLPEVTVTKVCPHHPGFFRPSIQLAQAFFYEAIRYPNAMLRLRKMRLILALPLLLAALLPIRLAAQDDQNADPNADPNDAPLGDVARTFRKKTPPSQSVIDDDNLSKVMEQAESHHESGSALRFLMASGSNGFHVSAPDVTCSLAFTANVKSLLSNQYAQMELPPGEVLKLEGPATVEGDALIVALLNRTDWHVSEVAVALTVVKNNQSRDASLSDQSLSNHETPIGGTASGEAKLLPLVDGNLSQEDEVRPEKKSDVTVIYRMRAAAPPSTTTVFSAPLNMELAPDEEWHWAIVQARGYPPQSYAENAQQTVAQSTAQTNLPASKQSSSMQPTSPPASAASQTSPSVPPPQN